MKKILFMVIMLMTLNIVAQNVDTFTITGHYEKEGDSAAKTISTIGYITFDGDVLTIVKQGKATEEYTLLPGSMREISEDAVIFQMVNYDYATHVYGVYVYYSNNLQSDAIHIVDSDLLTTLDTRILYTIE